MSRTVTIPATSEAEVTQRVERVYINYNRRVITVHYRTVETEIREQIDLPESVFDTIVTALNPDRLWTYIDNQT